MGPGLFFTGAWSLILFAASLLIASTANQFYVSTLPFIVTSGLIVILAFIAAQSDRLRRGLYWAVVSMHWLLFVPFFFALNRWPGGDDGPGLAWLLFIGSGSFIAFILAIVFAIKGANIDAIPDTEKSEL
ncbi:MAG: hypothetical protein ABW092_20270 [Candidatus Thiodiazotropha sp.]